MDAVISGRELLCALCVGLASCGAAPASPTRPDGSGPIDFTYEMDGQPRHLADLRGRPVLLVLIRTSELPSQAYMREVVEAFTRSAGRVRFLVLTIQPSEAPFVGLFAESEDLPFPVGVAEWAVAEGSSQLGLVPVVPTTYLIDEDGIAVDAAAGKVRADDIVEAIERHVGR